MRNRLALALATLLAISTARADDPDESALLLADQAPERTVKASDWRTFIEGAAGSTVRRGDGTTRDSRRLSLDVQYDHSFSPEWRVFLADRLDASWPAQSGNDKGINTLKEAYGSWRTEQDTLVDMGRINVRNGVALGYNPTDYFRSGALRSVVSINPASLKENRQGSLMVRGQRLWENGSVTALYSPELNRRPTPEGLSPDVGATNHRNRWLVAVSQKIGDIATPQFLLYKEEDASAQYGLNLTGLVNDAVVAHFEWSGGRSPSLLTQALQQLDPVCSCSAWHNQVATGLTYTTPNKISLTAEYHYNGGGLDGAAWNALRRSPFPIYGQYRRWVQLLQDLPTREELFVHGLWQDALINHLDLSAMQNFDLVDSSRRTWLEARYHVEQFEYAVQWQRNSGAPTSNFGASPESRSWQVSARYYF